MLEALKSLTDLLSWFRRGAVVVLCAAIAVSLATLITRVQTALTDQTTDNTTSTVFKWFHGASSIDNALILVASTIGVVALLSIPRRKVLRVGLSQARATARLIRSRDNEVLEKQLLEGSGLILSEGDVQARLRDFSIDASAIDVFAGDADFLMSDPKQREELRSLARRCRVLLNVDSDTPLDAVRELTSAGVRVRQYPPSNPPTLLRGRIKSNANGRSACLFDRVNDKFEVLNLRNRRLLGLVANDFESTFTQGRDPLIHYILFDLAGVAFKGDIQRFFDEVAAVVGIPIPVRGSDHLLVDEQLNLGTVEIDQVIATRVESPLDPAVIEKVRRIWLDVWQPDPGVASLARQLTAAGYETGICSNCDNLHSDQYKARKQLDSFNHWFLSNEMHLVKPKTEYFNAVTADLDCEPWQCLFIDDAPENIRAARAQGMMALHVPGEVQARDEVADWLQLELANLGIAPDRLRRVDAS